jgi:hypothetical protein
MWWAEVPEGWDAAELTTPVDRKGYGDGGYAGTPTYEPRTLTITGAVAAPTPETLDLAYRPLPRRRAGPARADPLHPPRRVPQAMGLWCDPDRAAQVDRGGHPRRRLLLPARRRGPHQDRLSVAVRPDPAPHGAGGGRLPDGRDRGAHAVDRDRRGDRCAHRRAVATPATNRHAVYRVTGPVPRPGSSSAPGSSWPSTPTSARWTPGPWTPPPAPPPSTGSTATTPGRRAPPSR